MLPEGRRIGAHLPLGGGMVKAAERAHTIGATALQIFSDNPTAWRRRTEPPAELPAFRAKMSELGIGTLAIHASYLINLAGPDEDFYTRSIGLLSHEMGVAPLFGARFVNVHVGSHRGTSLKEGAARVGASVGSLMAEVRSGSDAPLLVLENSAGGGFGIGATIEELAEILEAISSHGVDPTRVGFCLDIAHLWGAGYDVRDPAAFHGIVERFEALIRLDRLAMIHLNDTKSELGSHTDRHQHIGAGSIGAVGIAGILCHPALEHVTYILETPGMDEGYDAVNMARVRDLLAGRTLPLLPEESLSLRGGRSRTNAEPSGTANE